MVPETREPSDLAARIKARPAAAVKIDFSNMEIQPWDYQAQDIAWMLAQHWGGIASDVGTGKTLLGIGAASYLAEKGRLGGGMVVLMPKQGGLLLRQWEDELKRFSPQMRVATVANCKNADERQDVYRSRWDVLLVNYEAARMLGDQNTLRAVLGARQPQILFCDEASVFRNSGSQVAHMVRSISHLFPFRYAVTGTMIQTKLEDLWGIFDAMRWNHVVGNKTNFLNRYVVRRRVPFWMTGKDGERIRRWKTVVTGYRNVAELRERVDPWIIRRTLSEPEVGKRVPDVVPYVLRVPMLPRQIARYRQVARSQNLDDAGRNVAFSAYHERVSIADGLRTFDEAEDDVSAKSDWVMSALNTQLAGEKVVIFSKFVRSIWPLTERLNRAGIGHELYVGSRWQKQKDREQGFRRFQQDPRCRVLIATQAMEMGVDLGTARVLIFYSSIPNPARMEQILGRIRRAGNPYPKVVAVTLMSQGTVEEAVYDSLVTRNAIGKGFWQEDSLLYERLGTSELVRLMREDSAYC